MVKFSYVVSEISRRHAERKGAMDLAHSECQGRLGGNIYRNCVFFDAIDLWACYAPGYLSGRFIAGDTTKFTAIVRHADLVAYPTEIINVLALKNLRHKVVDGSYPKVTPIDSYVGGHHPWSIQ